MIEPNLLIKIPIKKSCLNSGTETLKLPIFISQRSKNGVHTITRDMVIRQSHQVRGGGGGSPPLLSIVSKVCSYNIALEDIAFKIFR